MAKSNNQKGKILYLARLLEGTGEDHTASMQDILTYLSENGIQAERKSIYDDMEVLRGFGLDIRYRRGRPGGYYVARTGESEPAGVPVTAGQEPVASVAISPVAEGDAEKRAVKLTILDEAGRDAVLAAFGAETELVEKPEGTWTATVEVTESPAFYGWLTGVGLSVRLTKPKKLVQSYREYLKLLAREYKAALGQTGEKPKN